MRLLFFILLAPSLFASYLGNPADPAIMNTGIFTMKNPFVKATTGYIWDYISNKDFVSSSGDSNIDPTLKRFAIHTQSASATLIFLERLQLTGTAGGSKQSAEPMDLTNITVGYHGTYQFSWSTGLKVVLLQWGKTYFCTDFNYFTIPSSPKSFFKFLNRMNLPLDLNKQRFYLREWEIAAGLASRFYFVTPYVGTLYMRSKLHINAGAENEGIDYYNKKNWGFYYGVTVSITGRLHLNFERRVRDEYAYTFGSSAVF